MVEETEASAVQDCTSKYRDSTANTDCFNFYKGSLCRGEQCVVIREKNQHQSAKSEHILWPLNDCDFPFPK